MIWVTWRQHRIEALIAGVVLAGLIIILLVLGIEMTSTYQSTGLANCSEQLPACGELEGNFINHFSLSVNLITIMLTTLPLLVGMFIGAPLVARELEQRTHRLVWTQSITRMRWLGTKLLLLIGVTLLAFIALIPLIAWWSAPWDAVTSPWSTYEVRGIVLPAYALFALVLGIAAGILSRRPVAGIGITIVLFILLRLAIAFWLRPYFLPPLVSISSIDRPGAPSHTDWLIEIGTIDRTGQELSNNTISHICPQIIGKGDAQAFAAFQACEQQHGFHSRSFYQPADRFWLFQVIESSIFLLLAIAFLVPGVWFVSKKLT
ncbi:MAG TPA: hypothetical protein VFA41_01755 [Ktedonobacteraceae bacterium]|jgi:hypothetical protein|nr:hypothetical protein [Ktedonobacteraceae bacterium]